MNFLSKIMILLLFAVLNRKFLYFETLNYEELLQKSINLAAALRKLGYYQQNVVATICSENCLEFFIPQIAGYFNLSITAPLNHKYTLHELDHALKISRPKLVFCSREVLPKFIELRKKFECIERILIFGNKPHKEAQTLSEFIDQTLINNLGEKNIISNNFKPLQGDPKKLCALILTSSGTTGLPKGVALSHLNLNVRVSQARDPNYIYVGGQTVLGLLPFFHSYGNSTSSTSFLLGDTVICLKTFDEDIFLKSIQDFKIRTLLLAPPLAIFIAKSAKVLKYDLSSVTDVLCGAAPLTKEVEEEVKKRLNCNNMRQGYGLTETTLAVTSVGTNVSCPGSCGQILPYLCGKIVDPKTEKSLGPGKVGELWWKGPQIMLGYFNNAEATKETISADGWLKSGDLGYYDENRYFYIVDRLKELIKFKGFQVAPAELEGILLQHPKIDDAGVVGKPDSFAGELPVAFVVKKSGVELNADEVKMFVEKFVSPQKRLSGGVIFVDTIPKNASGKILRRELRELLKTHISSKL